ncbi:MAG: TrmB family transcriptional regulator [Halanaeroarchaeum sp.]
MDSDPHERARTTAIETLESLGLSSYAARTFVALVQLGEGTANEVSTVADVPRTRVYDAAAELADHGLVDVLQSSPKRFWAISTETTGRHFEQTYTERVNTLTDALDTLAPVERSAEQRGVWTVSGQETVTDRVLEFVASAEEEVVYMTVGGLLTERVTDGLRAASDRDVSIRLAEMSNDTERELVDQLPAAEFFDSIWEWSETPAGRLLMVDGEKTLVSVLENGMVDDDTDSPSETAIWGAGKSNNLVVVLRVLFTWQLDEPNV